jgi:hypothetical protein
MCIGRIMISTQCVHRLSYGSRRLVDQSSITHQDKANQSKLQYCYCLNRVFWFVFKHVWLISDLSCLWLLSYKDSNELFIVYGESEHQIGEDTHISLSNGESVFSDFGVATTSHLWPVDGPVPFSSRFRTQYYFLVPPFLKPWIRHCCFATSALYILS